MHSYCAHRTIIPHQLPTFLLREGTDLTLLALSQMYNLVMANNLQECVCSEHATVENYSKSLGRGLLSTTPCYLVGQIIKLDRLLSSLRVETLLSAQK